MDAPEIDQAVADLQYSSREWARLPLPKKIAMFETIRTRTAAAAERWVEATVSAKGIPPSSPLTGEEWASGPWAFLNGLNATMVTLKDLAAGRKPRLGAGAVRTRAEGQVVVRVFPTNSFDRLLLSGVRGEVWMQPGVTQGDLADTMAGYYDDPTPEGAVALVLGAGNISSITPLDMLHKLVAEGQVCIVKMNPVNDYLGPIFEEIFEEMIDAGFVRFVYGGSDVGAYLTTHPDVDEIHMTGSESTFNAIVFGPGDEGEARRLRKEPFNNRPISAELGGVGPTVVLPGPWSEADICFQAEHIATQKLHNTGCNCIATQVLVLPETWPLADRLLEAVKETIRSAPPREPYYPGMADRQALAVSAHPAAELLDDPQAVEVPRTMICGLDPKNADEFCFNEEFFGATYSQTALPGATAAEFLDNAVRFCNQTLRGTLGINLIIHPTTMRELGPRLEEAVADLCYGSIAINCWVGLGYLLAQTTWGAFPGHPDDNIQSGRGVVHNSLLFDRPQKSVVYAPFYPFPRTLFHGQFHLSPKPPWFITNRQAHTVGRRLARFSANPGLHHIPGIFLAALRG